MGSIRKLKEEDLNIHLLFTKSNLSELYVYDTLKEKCNANIDSIYTIDNKNSIVEMLDLVNIQPFMAKKWLFIIDYKKCKSVFKDKIGVFDSQSSEFLIKVSNYKEFKEVKSYLTNVNDLYLVFMKYYDIEYLLQGYSLSPKIINFVSKSYSQDVDQVFKLRNELANGLTIEKRKQIIDICGVSAGSLNSYALSLLKDPPKSDKGFSMVCKNRVNTGVELAETYGFSKMRNFLLASVKDILDIKLLYMSGIIYDRISDLPTKTKENKKGEAVPVFDEKRLSKYKMYLNTIINIPYNRVARLYLILKEEGIWYRDIDMVNFIYRYYSEGGI